MTPNPVPTPQSLPPDNSHKRLCAEFLGTFALVFVGAGAVIMESHTGMSHQGLPDGKVRLFGIAFAHGLTLTAMICALGSYSGGHFNPAVSFAAWTRGRLKTELLSGYVLSQLAGAAVAGLFLAGIFPDEVALAKLGTPGLAEKVTPLKGIAVEAIITFFLVLTVLFVTREDNDDSRFAGVAIGSVLAAVILFAGPLTGGAANPARFFGPALASGELRELLIYFIGPLLGAGAASLAFWFVTEGSFRPLMAPAVGHAPPPRPPAMPAPHPPAMPAPAEEGAAQPLLRAQPTLAEAEILQTAQAQFDRGNWREAAQTLIPLLWRFEDCALEVKRRVRSLLIVIEDEAGEMNVLDRYRDLIYQRG